MQAFEVMFRKKQMTAVSLFFTGTQLGYWALVCGRRWWSDQRDVFLYTLWASLRFRYWERL